MDAINGGDGTDSLTINIANGVGAAGTAVAALPVASVTGIEVLNIRSAVDLTANPSSWTSVTDVNVTQSAAIDWTAADTTNVAVSGATGNITVKGGKDVTVNDATADTAITVSNGATGNAAGAISVTDTKQGTGGIDVDGGTTVSVTASIDAKTTAVLGGDITVGANQAASGAVTVVQNLTSNGGDGEADDLTAANIAVRIWR